MDFSNTSTRNLRSSTVGSRSTEVQGLKVLKTPEEGGTRKEYEEYLETIQNHIAVAWEGGSDLKKMIKNCEEPEIEEPEELSDQDSKSKLRTRLWNMKVESYAMKMELLSENKGSLFSLMMNNISKLAKEKLRSNTNFNKKEEQGDVIWLINSLDDIIVKFEKVKPNTLCLDDQLERIMSMRQKGNMSNEDFIKAVKKETDIYEKHGGTFLWADNEKDKLEKMLDSAVKKKEADGEVVNDTDKKEMRERFKKILKDEILAMVILKRACSRRFKELITHCKNEYLLGRNIYPTSTSDLLKVLNNYEVQHPVQQARNERRTSNSNINTVSFLQSSGNNIEVKYLRGTNRSFNPSVICRRCFVKGHYQSQCPVAINDRGSMLPIQSSDGSSSDPEQNSPTRTENPTGASHSQEGNTNSNSPSSGAEVSYRNGFGMSQRHSDAYINPSWILLDSESSEHIFRSKELLEDIEPTTNGEILRLYSNGGYMETNLKGKFGNFEVWYSPKSLANILSLALVTEEYRVTLDTGVDNSFIMHITEYHKLRFRRHSSGLYYFDVTTVDVSKLKAAFNFLNTVSTNKSNFGKREIRKADEARSLNRKVNHIAKDKFERIIKDSWIRNVPFTLGDVRRSHIIYGPPIPPLKGRTKYQEPTRIPDAHDVIQLPVDMYEDLKDVTLCIDFHFVNGITVFHTISRKIGYRTVSFPISKSTASIVKELQDVCKRYNARGFKVIEVHGDKEFEKIEKEILPIRLRTVAVDEHVPEIERSIQTQKNENRSVCYAMPYKCIPRVMVREIISQGNAFLNAFGNKESALKGLSPRNIIDNLPHIDYHDLKYEFGQYVQLHVTERFTNTMKSRTIGAIVLGPNKIQGTYNFMSLETGSKISGRVVSELPISDEVIKRVEELGMKQNQPYRASRMLLYEWKPGLAIDEEDVDPVTTAPSTSYNLIIPSPIDQNTKNRDYAIHPSVFVPNQGAYIEGDSDEDTFRDDQVGVGNILKDKSQGAKGKVQGAREQNQTQVILHIGDPSKEFTNSITDINEEVIDNRNEVIDDENDDVVNMSNNITEANEAVIDDIDEVMDDENDDVVTISPSNVNDLCEEAIDDTNEVMDGMNVDIESKHKNQGAHEVENQGAFREDHIILHDDDDTIEVAIDGGIVNRDIEGDDESEIEERRNKERERRGEYFKEHVGDNFGRGKRDKKPNQAYSFLQSEFKCLSSEEKKSYFKHAWEEYKVTGATNMLEKYTTGLIFTQMSARKGINKYKEEAERMLLKEFEQLLEYKTFHGVKASSLTYEQRKKAGNMINLIEEKINRGHTPENPVLKGRSCFNGKVQRGLYTKEQTASPTVSQDAFFLTCIIDAVEGRSKAITDVKGAYLNAKMKDIVIMKIIGPEIDMFCRLDPGLRKFVTRENGKRILYTQLDKALYGCVQSALLWYELYSNTLKEMGFILNPYDLCVANSMIEGKQCTICWYVDDNKISHADPKVINDIISKIEDKFGKMSKTMGDEHDFLGMNIKYKNKKVEISMKKHILKAINEFMDDITKNATTPAKSYLFNVRESEALDEQRAENFHSVVALLLFVSRRCRLDIQTAVAFLTTRVSKPTEDDWRKLKRVLQYLRGTIDLKLTLGADDILKAKSWVDVSYGVHDDCRSHTGGAMSWGWGVLLTKCQKQKLNTKSSTEGEIVGLSDYLPNVIWARMFLEGQGYILSENIVYQDNMSAMKLELNGKQSSGQKTKHMNNRYFWIKDRVKREGISIQYCPTERMIADFFTKPLQGSLFKMFRNVILGYEHISVLNVTEGDSISEERVRHNEELAN